MTKPSTSDDPMPAVKPADRMEFWKTSLHESAHLVSARVLLKKTARATVFSDGSGVASVGGGVPTSFKAALVAAAGIAAGSLADLYAPPQGALPTPAEIAFPQTAGQMHASVRKLMPDATAIARWAIEGHETEPETWAARHDWVHSSALEFVMEHRHEIVETATVLFGCGTIMLPAEPAEGVADVD